LGRVNKRHFGTFFRQKDIYNFSQGQKTFYIFFVVILVDEFQVNSLIQNNINKARTVGGFFNSYYLA
jgi:hypothetical protein